MTKTEEKITKEAPSSFSVMPAFLVLFAFSLLIGIYFYYNKVILTLKKENKNLSEIVNQYKELNDQMSETYNKKQDLIKFHGEALNKISEMGVNVGVNLPEKTVSTDFKEENDKEINLLKERINALNENIKNFKTDSFPKILNKAKVDFKNELKIIQEKANIAYLKKIKRIIKEEESKDFAYYHHYNETERAHLSHYVDRAYSSTLTDKVISIISSISQKFKVTFDSFKNNEARYEKTIESNQSKLNEVSAKINTIQENTNKELLSLLEKDNKKEKETKVSFINTLSNIKSSKEKIDLLLKNYLSDRFEHKEYYNKLYDIFGKNFNSKLIFNSKKYDNYEDILGAFKSNIFNKKNLLFFVQAEDDSVFGSFLSKLEDVSSLKTEVFHTFTDSDSFLYFFKSKENKYMTHKAFGYAKNNIGYEMKDNNWRIAFGSIYGNEGLSFAFQKNTNNPSEERAIADEFKIINVSGGVDSIQYDDLKSGIFSQSSIVNNNIVNYRYMKILEIEFIENN